MSLPIPRPDPTELVVAPIKNHNAGPGQVKSGQDETTTLGPGLMAVFSAPLTTRLSDIVTRSNINTLHRHLPTLTPIHYINIKQVSWGLTSALSWPWQSCL